MSTFIVFDGSLAVLLLLACAFDVSRRRIPNVLLLAGLMAAFALHCWSGPPAALLTGYLAGFAVGLALFLPMYALGVMAAGDVKLMATVGAFTGPLLALQIALATYVAGGLLALAMVVALGRSREAFANVGSVMRPLWMRLRGIPAVSEPMPLPSVGQMPYAVAITLGALSVLWLRHS